MTHLGKEMREAVEARQNNIFGIKREKKWLKHQKLPSPHLVNFRNRWILPYKTAANY